VNTSLDALIPELIQPAKALVELAGRAGVLPQVTSTLRSHAEQERLYRRFRQGLNPYPVAPPGSSAHEYGYAFDMIVQGEQNQSDLGLVWQQWGGVYGGVGDPVHFEYPGFSLSDHQIPPQTQTGTADSFQRGAASVADTLLSFVPGLGQAEMAAFLVQVFGLSHSTAIEILASPMSWLQENYPQAAEFLLTANPLYAFLRGL
jgi:hypothetical protein